MIRRDPLDSQRRWRLLGTLVALVLFVAVSSLAWSDPPDLLSTLTGDDDTEAGSNLLECPSAVASLDQYLGVRSPASSRVTDPSVSLNHLSHAASPNKRAPPSH